MRTVHITVWFWIAIGVVALIVGLRVARKRRIEWKRLIREYEQTAGKLDYLDPRLLPPVFDGSFGSWFEVILAKKRIEALRKEVARAAEANRLEIDRLHQEVVALRTKDLAAEDYNRLRVVKKARLSDEDGVWVEGQLKRLADTRVVTLLERSRRGDQRAFLDLEAFISTNSYGECKYLSDTGKRYVYPPDWDALVTRLIAYPVSDHFRCQRTEFGNGEFGQFVVRALRMGSSVQLKFAYACCSRDNFYRNQISDSLFGKLTERVYELNVSLGLTTANPTTTTS